MISLKTSTASIGVIALALFAAACSDDKNNSGSGGAGGGGGSGGGTSATFAITSPSFKNGDDIPDEFTCEGKPFGEGISPALTWTAGPAATKSYALVFKDTSLSEATPPDPHGYHWAMWNISKDTRALPESLGAEQYPLPGAEQYSGYPGRPFQFLGPCPSWMATKDATAALSNDSYSFVLYSLDVETLTDAPAQETGVNYVQPLDDYLKTKAIGSASLSGKSDAKPSSVPF